MKTFAPLSSIHALADFHQVGVSLKLKGWVLLYDEFIGEIKVTLNSFFPVQVEKFTLIF